MANRTNILRTHMLHKRMAANEPDSQNNCSMCPPFSRTTAFSFSRQWSIDLSMICWWTFSQQVRTLSSRSSRLDTCSAAELLIYRVNNRAQVWVVGEPYRWFDKFPQNIFFVCERHRLIVRVDNLCHYNIHCFLLDLGSFTKIRVTTQV